MIGCLGDVSIAWTPQREESKDVSYFVVKFKAKSLSLGNNKVTRFQDTKNKKKLTLTNGG